ncbi:MAG TPA: collagen-like protein [Solirubrobacterales bacterium]|nr:collagen-like protein [Solirubrobacterales bacterium]
MNAVRNIKRPKLATIMALLALFVAVGGSATAASGLINGKKIKHGTITAKQIRNKTITPSKLAPATAETLKGEQGPKGAQGEKGDTGAKGEKGDTGLQGIPGSNQVTTFSVNNNLGNIPANSDVDAATINPPFRKYLIIAKALMFAQSSGASLSCAIETNNNGGSDEARWTSPANNSRNTVPMVLTTTANVSQIKVVCNPGSTIGSFSVDAIAIPVG